MRQASGRSLAPASAPPSTAPEPPPGTPPSLSQADLETIDAICSGFPPKQRIRTQLPIPARAATLLRSPVAARLGFSPTARLLYVLMAHHFSITGAKGDDTVSVPIGVVARWLNCSKRSATRAIAELTRTGRIPLLLQEPGKPGKASRYEFVHRPSELAAIFAKRDAAAIQHRQLTVIDAQKRIFAAKSAGVLSAEAADKRLKQTANLRTWGTRKPKERKPRTRRSSSPPAPPPRLMPQSQYENFAALLSVADGCGPDGRTLSEWYQQEAARYLQLGLAVDSPEHQDEDGNPLPHFDFDYWQDRFASWHRSHKPTYAR